MYTEQDMNILLGNAIETAMEASMRVDERKRNIIARAKKVAGQIFITIDNQFDGIVRSKEGTMLSGKRDYKKTVMETYPWMLWLPNIRDR